MFLANDISPWLPPKQMMVNGCYMLATTTLSQLVSNFIYNKDIYHQIIPDNIYDWITFPKTLGILISPITLNNDHSSELNIFIVEPIIIATQYMSAISFYTSTKLLVETIANFDIYHAYTKIENTILGYWGYNTPINLDSQCNNDESMVFNSWLNYSQINSDLQCSNDEHIKFTKTNPDLWITNLEFINYALYTEFINTTIDSWVNDIDINLNPQFLNVIYTTSSMILWGAQIAYDTENSINNFIERMTLHEYLE